MIYTSSKLGLTFKTEGAENYKHVHDVAKKVGDLIFAVPNLIR